MYMSPAEREQQLQRWTSGFNILRTLNCTDILMHSRIKISVTRSIDCYTHVFKYAEV